VISVTAVSADEHGHSTAENAGTASATTEHADTAAATTESAAAGSTSSEAGDVLARVLGIGGLAVGAVGIVLAVTARRKTSA
jgi:hypothetical protein